MLISAKKLLYNANKGRYAIGAFNICNMEVLQSIVNAASKLKAPVILQTSESSIKYAGLDYLYSLTKAIPNNVQYALHLDHGKDLSLIKRCINIGYNSVMFDGSRLKFDDNIKKTKNIVNIAHKKGVAVEGELGTIGDPKNKVKNIIYTNPELAKEFVNKTGVDSLAVAIGTSHGAYKFNGKPNLRFDILKTIKDKTKIPLVLHGASEIPKSLTDKLKKLGMKLGNTQGIPNYQLKKAIKLGINKVNIDTDIRLAFNLGLRKSLNNKEIDPRELLNSARIETQKIIEDKILILGSKGKSK